MIDMTNRVYGRWTVLRVAGKSNGGSILWQCRCECGAEKTVNGATLRVGESRSCGCLHNELASSRASSRPHDQIHNYKGGRNNRGSEAFYNRRIRTGLQYAELGNYLPVNLSGKELSLLYDAHTQTCDLCGVPEIECTQGLCIDHCHKTGEFRGFLCKKCNTALGMLNDDPEMFLKAAQYLSPLGV